MSAETVIHYFGERMADRRLKVSVREFENPDELTPLPPRHDLFNHSPDGFECGYGGSGPAQLALALLAHHLGDDARAVRLHQTFKWLVVAKLPKRGSWIIEPVEIDETLEAMAAQGRDGAA